MLKAEACPGRVCRPAEAIPEPQGPAPLRRPLPLLSVDDRRAIGQLDIHTPGPSTDPAGAGGRAGTRREGQAVHRAEPIPDPTDDHASCLASEDRYLVTADT